MLTPERIAHYKAQMVQVGTPIRFLKNGQAMNIITGHLARAGSNVLYHPVYWNFTKDTSKAIAAELGVKAVFGE